ncbi:MAG: RNA polymerase sigma factor [Chloroflexi bacterium]|nr:MAG: RNA polymerase sigma factor [Chloroflexota bacterium]
METPKAASLPNAREAALVSPTEDAALAQRARDGDPQAFAALYDRYFELVYRYVYYRVREVEEAEDVTSEVFFRALRAMPRYEPRQPFLAWLYRIARNAVIDRARAARPRVSFEDALAHPDAGDHVVDPDARILATDRRARLKTALGTLTAEQQEVVILRFVEGLSAEEVGKIMGKRPGTVRGLQFRALQALKKTITAEDLR